MPRAVQQSGVLPYRVEGKRIRILLITSSSGKRWVIPKGMLEPNLTPWQSAGKEALEEAGVMGEVSKKPFGAFAYEKWQQTFEVEVYAMRVDTVLPTWDEMDYRDRKWLSPEKAANKLGDKGLRKLIGSLGRLKTSELPV